MEGTRKVQQSSELLSLESRPSGPASPFLISGEPKPAAAAAPKTKPQISKVPESEVFSRVRAFLPQLAAANSQLEAQMKTKPKQDFDIEHVDEAHPHIEMNLALGILEPKKELDETNIIIPGQTHSDDDSDSDEVKLEPITTAPPPSAAKPAARKKRTRVVATT